MTQDLTTTENSMSLFAQELDRMKQMATMLANAKMLPDDINTPEKIFLLMQQGKELGLSPMQSINNIYVINGRTAINTNMMAALIKRSGKYKFTVMEWTSKICKMEFFERVSDAWESLGVIDYTIEEATHAGFFKPNKYGNVSMGWAKYPKEMMKARCLSRGARMYCADVIQGMYDVDELKEEIVEIDAKVVTGKKDTSVVDAQIAKTTVKEVYDSISQRLINATKESQLESIRKQVEKNKELGMFSDDDLDKLESALIVKEQELKSANTTDGNTKDNQ